MNTLPSLPDLTPDDRVWRLAWFGDCAYPAQVRRYAQPSLKAVLSPLLEAADPESADRHYQRDAWVPVSMLPILAVGDLWQHGRQIASPDYHVETFKRLRITPSTTAFVKAGLALGGHFLLPLSWHPWHIQHTQSYCVSVDLEGGGRLLIPCMEIIRFYFGSTGNLIQRLFRSPFSSNALWAEKRFNMANKHLHLVLANRLSGVSAADIGRIAESKHAWRSAAGIYASCQKASVQRHPVYPYTGFPFEGITDLVASGTWLPFGDREQATFIVCRLRTCSYPFPFRSLSYEAADKKAWHDASAKGNKGEGGKYARERDKTQEVTDKDPGARKAQRKAQFTAQCRFPDLLRKQIWREKIEAMPKADIFLRRADGILEQVAYGEPDGSSSVGGMDTTQKVGEKEIELPRFVQEGLKIIRGKPEYADLQVTVVCALGRAHLVFRLPVVIDEYGEIDSNLLFTLSDGSVRQRRGCCLELDTESQQKYLLIAVRLGPARCRSVESRGSGKASGTGRCPGRGCVSRPR